MVLTTKEEYKDSELGRIPKDWEVVELTNLVTSGIQNGVYKHNSQYGEGTQILRVTDFYDGQLSKTQILKRVRISEQELSQYRLQEGDIVINRVNSIQFVGKSMLVPLLKEPLVFESNMMRFRVNEKVIDPRFLILFLNLPSTLTILRKRAKKAVHQASINQKDVFSLRILLPSLREQNKIISVLESVDDGIQKSDESIVATGRLKQGLMEKLLSEGTGHTEFKDSELGKIPKEWGVVKIGDNCEVGTGGTPNTKCSEYFGGPILWLKSGDIKGKYVNNVEGRITEAGLNNSNAKIYPSGSVVIALSGRGKTRGTTAIIKRPMACSQSVAVMVPNKNDLNPEFLHYALSSRYHGIRNLTGDNDRSGLNLRIIRNILIPLPAIKEQLRIVDLLSAVDEKFGLECQRREKLERIKRGLMDDLLTERKRVKLEVA